MGVGGGRKTQQPLEKVIKDEKCPINFRSFHYSCIHNELQGEQYLIYDRKIEMFDELI